MKKAYHWLELLAVVGLVLVGLAACGQKAATTSSGDTGYKNSINKGLDAVAEEKYSKALTYFDNALTQKPKDPKAKAYRDQTQAYIDTRSQLKAGEVQTAVTTVTAGVKITNGAKSLTTKLSELRKTARDDLAEYQKLDKAVTAQLSVTDNNYDADVIKQCEAIDWTKKPYLKKLKVNVNKLLKRADQSSSASSSMTDSSSSTDNKVSATDHKEAVLMRKNIVQSDPGHWDSAALEQVPDSVIVAATNKSNEMGGDPGTTANMIAKQYPNIKKNNSSDTDKSSSESHSEQDDANQVRQVLVGTQGFSKSVLAGIPDSEILNAAKPDFMTNSDIARTAGTLLKKSPNLK
ncbi:hypothetical protein D1831_14070 [Lactiplantibacillus garii]|uniref:Lipoprotein n=1 Tax=Lactiplantibacillus garii TaxID=2306423 RepID=A0A3R8KJB4_9LACO|nr:hypothetical protein [Lactiplantibacillus garii]RRK09217.1 hypothetical protein D1831_14070 [Lactiplantibacillus garii]